MLHETEIPVSSCSPKSNARTGCLRCSTVGTYSHTNRYSLCPQATDVRVSIKGGAAARAEVRERRDGAVEVTYTAPMSGEYRIALGVGTMAIGTYRAQCAPPRPSEALSQVCLSRLPDERCTEAAPYLCGHRLACMTARLSRRQVCRARLLQGCCL